MVRPAVILKTAFHPCLSRQTVMQPTLMPGSPGRLAALLPVLVALVVLVPGCAAQHPQAAAGDRRQGADGLLLLFSQVALNAACIGNVMRIPTLATGRTDRRFEWRRWRITPSLTTA